MKTSSNNTETVKTDLGYADDAIPTPPGVEPEVKPDENAPDDYGYSHETKLEDKKPDEEEKPTEDKKLDEEEEKPIDPATGYEKEIPKPAEDKKPDEEKPTEDKKPDEEFTKEKAVELLGDLGDNYDVESISEFAIENNFSKEQLEAYVGFVKSQDDINTKSQENAILEQRASWKQELKDDKDFSGQNGEDFMKNVDQVEKVLNNMMPNTRKILTDRGTMLPPYIMRDLLNVHRIINPKSKLINGDPSTPIKKEKGNFLDEMYE